MSNDWDTRALYKQNSYLLLGMLRRFGWHR